MQLDESALTAYLVKHLQPLTSADPGILAKYIIVLLRKDKSTKELQELCSESLVDFLGHSTKSFVTNLFQAIEGGVIVRSLVDAVETMTFEPPPHVLDQEELPVLPSKGEEYFKSRKEQGHASSSGSTSDSEDQEVSDDDDDDRNHKHRKRDSRPQSFDEDNQGAVLRRPIRRPNRSDANGDIYNASHLRDMKNVSNASFVRDSLMKFDKHSSGLASLSHAHVDLSQRGRINQSRNGSSSHTESSSSFSRPSGGKGRGRGTGNWNQQDSRFVPLGSLDFPSHMAPRAPSLPGLFVGTNLPSAAGAQGASWGSFGFIPGMPNGCMDPLLPLSMPGALQSTIGPQMNINMSRQRCRDFEEKGFCLRGDMCPMEHGVNRIVVEDVQSLSQFNLPVTVPTSHAGGLQSTSGPLPSAGALSSLPRNKAIPNKVNKPSVMDDRLGVNDVLSSSAAAGDNDVYDPDKPLWSNDCLDMSRDPLRAPVSDDPEPFQGSGPSILRDYKLPYKGDSNADDSSSYGQGRYGSGNKSKVQRKTDNAVAGTRFTENNTSSGEDITVDAHGIPTKRALATAEASQKASISAPGPRFRKDSRRNAARTSQKASRTLFVNCIPVKNNRRDALLSHFQKFGTVVDIYIPLNGEKAFVQFSKREEAEAALESPEAVMGNRFIKLFWANRDNIADDIEGMEEANTPAGCMEEGKAGYVRAAPLALKPSLAGEPQPSVIKAGAVGTEPAPTAPKASSVSTAGTAPVSAVQPKASITNTSKVMPVVQKKRENLETLKEELRRKQEMLEQKRNEFKNQLEKLEKQRLAAKKSGATSEKLVKKQKVEKDTEVIKFVTSKSCNHSITGLQSNTLENSHSDSPVVPNSFKSSLETNKLKAASAESDHQLSGFRILPPLPSGFANLGVVEDHFSIFEDLVCVDLEELEAASACESSRSSSSFSARVIFSTFHSAERAFSDGNCWQDQKLKFAWLRTGSPCNDPGSEHVSPNSNMKENAISDFRSELMTARCSSSNSKVQTCGVIPEAVDGANNHEHMDVEIENSSLDSTIEVQSCPRMQSSMLHDTIPEENFHQKGPNEDSTDVDSSQ